MWERIGFSVVVLLVSFGVQKVLSVQSRPHTTTRWGRDDWLLWSDWLASALVSAFAFLIVTSATGSGSEDGSLPGVAPPSIGVTIDQLLMLAFVVGMNILLPLLVNLLGYDVHGVLLTWRGIVSPNVFAALTVGVAVAVGVDFSD